MAQADSPTKTCGEDGCGRPLRARGLCSTHYNQQHSTLRHAKHPITCVVCGALHDSARRDGRYCSDRCKASDYKGRPVSPSSKWARSKRVRAARLKLGVAALGRTGRTWVAGRCGRCGAAFIDRSSLARFCSQVCQRRDENSRRRGRERSAEQESYSRIAVFERDGWRCHLCGGQTDRTAVVPHPKAPTVDHLVPLALGGADTLANVGTACFICNATKGARFVSSHAA